VSKHYFSDSFEDKDITPELAELIARSSLDPPVELVMTLLDYNIEKESTIHLGTYSVNTSLRILTSLVDLRLRAGGGPTSETPSEPSEPPSKPSSSEPDSQQHVLKVQTDKGEEYQFEFPAYCTLGDVKLRISQNGIPWTQQRLILQASKSVIEDGWTLRKLTPMNPFYFHLSMPRSLCKV
jgi:hypothetical protein